MYFSIMFLFIILLLFLLCGQTNWPPTTHSTKHSHSSLITAHITTNPPPWPSLAVGDIAFHYYPQQPVHIVRSTKNQTKTHNPRQTTTNPLFHHNHNKSFFTQIISPPLATHNPQKTQKIQTHNPPITNINNPQENPLKIHKNIHKKSSLINLKKKT